MLHFERILEILYWAEERCWCVQL